MVDWTNLTMGGPVLPHMPTKPWNGIVVVGEVPGVQEVARGVPFTGPSGEILDKIMESVGMDRDATIITNAFRWQPIWTMTKEGKRKPNDTSVFFTDDPSKANNRLPMFRNMRLMTGPDEDIRELWRLLKREQPRLIIACGAVALWALTGEDGITRHIGNYLETRAVGAKVMATWHPAHAAHKDDENVAVEIARCFKMGLEYVEALKGAAPDEAEAEAVPA